MDGYSGSGGINEAKGSDLSLQWYKKKSSEILPHLFGWFYILECSKSPSAYNQMIFLFIYTYLNTHQWSTNICIALNVNKPFQPKDLLDQSPFAELFAQISV